MHSYYQESLLFSVNEGNETLAYRLAHCILLYIKIHTNKNYSIH